METHLVYSGFYYNHYDDQLISFIINGMKKYDIKSLMLSIIFMNYKGKITKEEMKKFGKGIHSRKVSVNDDLESFFEDLRLGQNPKGSALTYFLPYKKEEKRKLVVREKIDPTYEKILDDLKMMRPELRYPKMKPPEEEFLEGWCQRRTFLIVE